jgi:branched-chain amino acid transport system substrate-binding protein
MRSSTHKMPMRRLAIGAAALAVGGLGAACGSSSSSGKTPSSGSTGASGTPIQVGLIYSQTGLLASYGKEYRDGFDAGLSYATKGTNKVNGHPIQVQARDAAGDPAKAVSAFKELVGGGVKIVAGPTSSGVAVQLAPLAAQNQTLFISGPAATDAITGVNKYTFRSGRQTYQDVATAGAMVGDIKGKSVLVFAQDYEFGQGNATAVKAVLGGAGANVSSLLVPLSAKDFTPYASQIKQKKPDLLFVAWAGDTTQAMWNALDQQGVFESTTVVTGLGDSSSFNAYGTAGTKVKFLSYYFPTAPHNSVNDEMIKLVKKNGGTPDLFTPDGFVAAQMIVHAIEKSGGSDVNKMISALEGWTFNAPKGKETVRASDHAMIQDMYIAQLQGAAGSLQPKLVQTVPADKVSPPAKQMGQS